MMKHCCLILAFALMLCGCGTQETFETIADDHAQAVMQEERGVLLSIPEEANAQAIQGEAGVIYLCDGFEVASQVVAAGDLNKTVKTMTGFPSDGLTVMTRSDSEYTRYEWVWSAAGEGGDVVARGIILDDGLYHYCLTMTADADRVEELQPMWQRIMESYTLA